MRNNNIVIKGICKDFKAFLQKEAKGKNLERYFSLHHRLIACR
jgi:hypothetical protein